MLSCLRNTKASGLVLLDLLVRDGTDTYLVFFSVLRVNIRTLYMLDKYITTVYFRPHL